MAGDAARQTSTPTGEDDTFADAGLAREELSFLNRLAFAGAARGRVADARAINAAAKTLAPDHACWAIGEYLCLLAEGRRPDALDTLEQIGLTQPRAWEQAAELLLLETAGEADADERARRARIVATLSATAAGRAALAEAGVAPAAETGRANSANAPNGPYGKEQAT